MLDLRLLASARSAHPHPRFIDRINGWHVHLLEAGGPGRPRGVLS